MDTKPNAGMDGYLYTGPGTLVMLLAEGALDAKTISFIPWMLIYHTAMMMMRVYALYERSRKVLVLLCFLAIVTIIFNILQGLGYMGGLLFWNY